MAYGQRRNEYKTGRSMLAGGVTLAGGMAIPVKPIRKARQDRRHADSGVPLCGAGPAPCPHPPRAGARERAVSVLPSALRGNPSIFSHRLTTASISLAGIRADALRAQARLSRY